MNYISMEFSINKLVLKVITGIRRSEKFIILTEKVYIFLDDIQEFEYQEKAINSFIYLIVD